MQATLELTNRCNERCTHCYIPKYEDDPKRILTIEQWRVIMDQLKDAGTINLILMGGEAMLNPLFFQIAEYAANKGFFVSLITNGLLINAKTAKKIADAGIANVTFSLYSLDAEIHDKMTAVKGSCAKTLKAIELIQDQGLQLSINCLLTKDNIETFFELMQWGQQKNIDVKFDPTVTPKYDHDRTPTKLRASSEQLKSFFKQLKSMTPYDVALPLAEPQDYICNAGKGKCAITAYGELLPCVEIRDVLGDLTKVSFENAWHSPNADKWRRPKVEKILDQVTTKEANICDHCPGMALHETGDAFQVTEFSKTLATIKKDHYYKDGEKSHER